MKTPSQFNNDSMEWLVAWCRRVSVAGMAVVCVGELIATVTAWARLALGMLLLLAPVLVAGWFGWWLMGNKEWKR